MLPSDTIQRPTRWNVLKTSALSVSFSTLRSRLAREKSGQSRRKSQRTVAVQQAHAEAGLTQLRRDVRTTIQVQAVHFFGAPVQPSHLAERRDAAQQGPSPR